MQACIHPTLQHSRLCWRVVRSCHRPRHGVVLDLMKAVYVHRLSGGVFRKTRWDARVGRWVGGWVWKCVSREGLNAFRISPGREWCRSADVCSRACFLHGTLSCPRSSLLSFQAPQISHAPLPVVPVPVHFVRILAPAAGLGTCAFWGPSAGGGGFWVRSLAVFPKIRCK